MIRSLSLHILQKNQYLFDPVKFFILLCVHIYSQTNEIPFVNKQKKHIRGNIGNILSNRLTVYLYICRSAKYKRVGNPLIPNLVPSSRFNVTSTFAIFTP